MSFFFLSGSQASLQFQVKLFSWSNLNPSFAAASSPSPQKALDPSSLLYLCSSNEQRLLPLFSILPSVTCSCSSGSWVITFSNPWSWLSSSLKTLSLSQSLCSVPIVALPASHAGPSHALSTYHLAATLPLLGWLLYRTTSIWVGWENHIGRGFALLCTEYQASSRVLCCTSRLIMLIETINNYTSAM